MICPNGFERMCPTTNTLRGRRMDMNPGFAYISGDF